MDARKKRTKKSTEDNRKQGIGKRRRKVKHRRGQVLA